MESKTTDFFADLERETAEMTIALNYLLAESEEDNRGRLRIRKIKHASG